MLIGLFIPMNWGAPQGPALVVRNSVPIVPDVAGEVIDVPVEPNKPLKAGDVLFRIDPTPYQSAQVDALQAQLKFQELRLSQMTQLQLADSGRAFDVEQRQAEVDQLKGAGRRREMESGQDRGACAGRRLRDQSRFAQGRARQPTSPLAPVMAFIDTSDTIIGVEIQQIDARYLAPGQPVELTFKFVPGKVYTGKVESILQAISTGQVQASGSAVTPTGDPAAPFVARVRLDDAEFANRLPAGSAGDAAIFTDRVKAAHVIRKVLLRQIAITNYVNPF